MKQKLIREPGGTEDGCSALLPLGHVLEMYQELWYHLRLMAVG